MFSAIASSVISAGASKFLGSATGGGKGSRVKTPEFSKRQAKVVSGVKDTSTEDIRFKEFAQLGTAGQVASLISRHESLMKAVDTDEGAVKGSIGRSTIA
tara:strand:+ start:1058 stop:1357 length:300 start_codon:yes stop_codon:yes gene_type:complete